MNVSAGIFFYSESTNRYLFLLRTDKNQSWSIPGGKIEKDETLYEGLIRECREEISIDISNYKIIPIQQFVNNTFVYHTFFCKVKEEFIPILNDEHCGYAWVLKNSYPKPLHPGLFNTINFDLVRDKLKLIEGN